MSKKGVIFKGQTLFSDEANNIVERNSLEFFKVR